MSDDPEAQELIDLAMDVDKMDRPVARFALSNEFKKSTSSQTGYHKQQFTLAREYPFQRFGRVNTCVHVFLICRDLKKLEKYGASAFFPGYRWVLVVNSSHIMDRGMLRGGQAHFETIGAAPVIDYTLQTMVDGLLPALEQAEYYREAKARLEVLVKDMYGHTGL